MYHGPVSLNSIKLQINTANKASSAQISKKPAIYRYSCIFFDSYFVFIKLMFIKPQRINEDTKET